MKNKRLINKKSKSGIMEQVFKDFSISQEYVIYFMCSAILLLTIAILEDSSAVPFIAFVAGLIAIFLSFLTCWDLIAVGITKHRVAGIIFGIFTLILFLGLIYDFIKAIV
jgi:hypothetical protein